MGICIYTMTHKKFAEPKDGIYVPLHVGKAGSIDLGYTGDDTGDNISALNPYYGELTGVYWVWKNDHVSDYIGICHYRRFFVDDHRELLSQAGYEKLLKDYDIIVSKAMQAEGTYLSYYSQAHNKKDIEAVGQAVLKLYSDDYTIFTQVMGQSKYYYGNLMVTSRELFFDYAAWLFSIFEEAQKNIDVSSYDLYNQRVFGFLSEQLLLVWITKRGLKVYECNVGITAEKAETVELKLALTQLVKMGEIRQAREMFYELLKIRPDVRLELSDVKGELPIMEQLLYIMEQETEHRKSGVYDYSHDLNDLVSHYKKAVAILEHGIQGLLTEEEERYCIRTGISSYFVLVVLLNTSYKPDEKQKMADIMRKLYLKYSKTDDALALEGVRF